MAGGVHGGAEGASCGTRARPVSMEEIESAPTSSHSRRRRSAAAAMSAGKNEAKHHSHGDKKNICHFWHHAQQLLKIRWAGSTVFRARSTHAAPENHPDQHRMRTSSCARPDRHTQSTPAGCQDGGELHQTKATTVRTSPSKAGKAREGSTQSHSVTLSHPLSLCDTHTRTHTHTPPTPLHTVRAHHQSPCDPSRTRLEH